MAEGELCIDYMTFKLYTSGGNRGIKIPTKM